MAPARPAQATDDSDAPATPPTMAAWKCACRTRRAARRSLTEIAGTPVALERPADAEHGDYATNVALKLAGLQKRAPREIAEEIAAQAVERGIAERAEAAGPGFVNLWVPDAWLAESVGEIVAAGAAFGAGSAVEPERIQVEMVSANPTGPITVASAERRLRRLRRAAPRARRP